MNIELRNLTLGYERKKIIDNLNLNIPIDGIFFILGPSGSGKSTLLYAIMGLIEPLSGDIAHVPPKISAVFQENRLFEQFSVYENIWAVDGKISEKEIQIALERTGLKGVENEKVAKLSGGMKRRVAIIRAVLADSQLVIMDEPFSGIDDENKQRTLDFILDHKRERGLIMSSHAPLWEHTSCVVLK